MAPGQLFRVGVEGKGAREGVDGACPGQQAWELSAEPSGGSRLGCGPWAGLRVTSQEACVRSPRFSFLVASLLYKRSSVLLLSQRSSAVPVRTELR